MKSAVKKIDSSTMELSISVEGDPVKSKFEAVFKEIGSQAKVKGFRPGHAPRELIEKEYSGLAHERVLHELVPELLEKSFAEHDLHVLATPQVKDVKLERAHLSFTAQVEVTPQIDVKNYKGIKINYKKIAAGADEIKRNIDSVKESRKADAVDDAFARTLGYPSVAELEQSVGRQLAVQKDNAGRRDVEKQIIDALTKGLEVKLPQSLVAKHLEEQLRQAKMELALRGVPREKIAAEEENLRKELTPQAQQQVKVYLILAEIAKREHIAPDDHMTQACMEFLMREASWNVVES
ncbi:MAG: trigger factor [Candidatus Omnitrophica bacterium]|nr:trigger factor [Candidatus Omnitrophota bacterium]